MGPTGTADGLSGLLQACRDDPADDDVRLVLADWLEERGDPRGELVRVQVQRQRTTAPERQADLTRREATLLRRHGWDWLRPLLSRIHDGTFRRGFLSVEVDAAAGDNTEAAWAWVDEVEVTEPETLAGVLSDPRFQGVTQFRFNGLHPVSALLLIPETMGADADRAADEAFAELARSPAAVRLTSLVVNSVYCSSAGLVALLASPHLACLRHLALNHTRVTAKGLKPLATLDHPTLQNFLLFGAKLGTVGGRLLARAPLLARLRRLELVGTGLGSEGLLAVFNSPHLARLEQLHLSAEQMTVGGVRALGKLPGLRSLALRDCELKAPVARALAGAPWPGGLECLDLSFNSLDNEAIAALAASPQLGGLRELNLGYNRLGDELVARLAASELTNLRRLDLSLNGLSTEAFRILGPWLARQRLVTLNLSFSYPRAEGVRLLADCPNLDYLVNLDFGGARIGEADGARALAAATWLGGVVRLDLSSTRIGPEGLHALLGSGRLGTMIDLSLYACELDDQGARLLADWPGLAGLIHLDLQCNDIGDEGAMALANSPYLSPSLRLDLGDNRQAEATNNCLRERLGSRLNLQRCRSSGQSE